MPNEKSVVPRSGLAIASLVLGIISFFPMIGVLLGVIAIILGIIALVNIKKKGYKGKGLAISGIVLGILGVLFTIIFYALFFHYAFGVTSGGPFGTAKLGLSKEVLTQNAGTLSLYKNKYGVYPENLTSVLDSNYTFYQNDFFGPLCYNVSFDKQSYTLESAGPDKICWDKDDILSSV